MPYPVYVYTGYCIMNMYTYTETLERNGMNEITGTSFKLYPLVLKLVYTAFSVKDHIIFH